MSKKNKKDRPQETPEPRLKDATKHTILAIVSLALALFFILSSRDMAGPVGGYAYKAFGYLFGTGYYLLPAGLLFVAFSFFRSVRPRIVSIRLIGLLVFVLSGLGLIALSLGQQSAGIVGWALARGTDALIGRANWVVFTATLLISIVLVFETSFSLNSLLSRFRPKPPEETEGDSDDEKTGGPERLPKVETPSQLVETNRPEPAPTPKKADKKAAEEELIPIYRADKSAYVPPPLSLLGQDSGKPGAGDIKANANIIKRTLADFGVEVEMDEISIGPSITRYAMKPAQGIKLSRIVALQNDLSLALAAHPLRVEAPIPGKSLVGIEVPNSVKTTVRLGSIFAEDAFQNSSKALLVALGKNITGSVHFADIAKMPHVLIAGTTGSGKSVTIHTFILSLLYRNGPDDLRFVLIDPKRVELTLYNKIPHLLTPVITNVKKAIMALKWAAKEMDRRYDILESEGSRDIHSYRENIYRPALEVYNRDIAKTKSDEEKEALRAKLPEAMPYIVIIIDELADMMSSYPRELEAVIVRIAQMSRAVGIHLILSTQRPSTEVITGLIKANVPCRVALQVPSQIDSRTIIDMPGAEKLLGAGDMLYLSAETTKPVRLQSGYVSEAELKKVVSFIVENNEGELDQLGTEVTDVGNGDRVAGGSIGDDEGEGGDDDDMYEEAKDTVQKAGKASSSLLQRKLKVGYARAARLLDMLEERGIVGPGSGAKPREVYGAVGGSGGSSATDEFAAEFDKAQEAQEENESR
jgi:DNA segregation ATPase FtsK/SpoIIIE, S-DNA-T family